MELIYELRKICGHDSYTVGGCLTCAAADEIERLKVALDRIADMSDEVYSKGAYCSKIAREVLRR